MKKKSSYTKAKEISKETKLRVLERQNYRSVISGVSLNPYKTDFHHYIYRSSGGVGYEWNIVAITEEEHRAIHDKTSIYIYGYETKYETMLERITKHLMNNYIGWDISKCKYEKYRSEEEYEVKRNY